MKRGRIQLTQGVQEPLFPIHSDWKPPKLSELPSWESAKLVGFDLETRDDKLKDLGIGVRRGGYIVGYSFAFDDGPQYYIPIRHGGGGNLDPEQGIRYLRDNLKQFRGQVVGANLSYDIDYALEQGVDFSSVECFRDVLVTDPLIFELHESYSLKASCLRWGVAPKEEELLKQVAEDHGLNPKSGLWNLHSKYVGAYGEADARRPLQIYHKQQVEVERLSIQQIVDLECKLTPVLVKMRRRGVRIDFDQLDKVEKWSIREQLIELQKIYDSTGVRVGLDDMMQTQVLARVFEAIGIKLGKTAKGQWNIDSEVLDNIDHPVADSVKRARKLWKLRTTFASSVREYQTNGRIHTTLNQGISYDERKGKAKGAAYGRLSCIRKGTLVDVRRSRRDVKVPIENVVVGDLAYCYVHGQLTLRRVARTMANGTRTMVRVHWNDTYRHRKGYVDLTSDHRVLLISGAWTQADGLQEGFLVCALSNGPTDYKITKVEPLNEEDDVYDLEIEEAHNFIAGEICVHNCSDPNLQQQPSRDEFASMWRAIYIPEEGHFWGCLDFSSQEPRWTTHFAAAMNLPKARETAAAYHANPRLDNHQFMAELTGQPRKYAKAIYLGICYNKGGASLCRELGLPTQWALRYKDGGEIEYFEARHIAMAARVAAKREGFIWEAAGPEGQVILKKFDDRAPFIRMLAKKAQKKAKEVGFVKTVLGRLLHFPEQEDGSYSFTEKSLNRIIQGSAGDQAKAAIVALDREMPDMFMNLQVHDEIDGSFTSIAQCKQASEIMTNVVKACIPFVVDLEVGPNWGNISAPVE